MKQRLLGALTAGSLLVGLVAVPSFAAQGGTERYQAETTEYTILVLGQYTHTFMVTPSPCDGSLAITGATPTDSGYYTTETVTGTLANDTISFTSVYDGPYNPGYTWSGSFPVAGGPLSADYTGTVTVASTESTAFKNHGEYVSSMGGGADAAHSCIGMPKVSGASDATDAAAVKADLMAIKARLLAKLEALAARLAANPHANVTAVPAIQRHVQVLTEGTSGLDRAAAAGDATPKVKPTKAEKPAKPTKPTQAATPTKPSKPTLPAQAQGHANQGSHSSKP